jgi:hypothetical protein
MWDDAKGHAQAGAACSSKAPIPGNGWEGRQMVLEYWPPLTLKLAGFLEVLSWPLELLKEYQSCVAVSTVTHGKRWA